MVPIELKPLRERKADVPVLSEAFFQTFCRKYGKEMRLSPGGMKQLMEYHWPGNIRELENMIERIVVTNASGTTISRNHVFAALHPGGMQRKRRMPEGGTLKEQVSAFERDVILRAIEKEGSIRKAAKTLGVDHSTLVKKCRQFVTPGENAHHSGEM